MKISGHRTPSVFRRYDITSGDDLPQAIDKVSAYVETLPEKPTVVPLAQAGEGRRPPTRKIFGQSEGNRAPLES